MTKDEAITAMKNGDKVTHRYFTPDEYIFMKGSLIYTEDGANCFPDEFWKYRQCESFLTDWSIYNDVSATQRTQQ